MQSLFQSKKGQVTTAHKTLRHQDRIMNLWIMLLTFIPNGEGGSKEMLFEPTLNIKEDVTKVSS